MTTSGKTGCYGVFGHPIDHTLSPFIMNRAFDECRIGGGYVVFDVGPDDFPDAIRGACKRGMIGANITYPYKERILEYVDRRSSEVEVIGAANTLRVDTDALQAHNTDAQGTVTALATLGGVSPAGKNVFVFGAGGAGRAAAFGLLTAGAAGVTFGVRNTSANLQLLERYQTHFPTQRVGHVSTAGKTDEFARAIEEAVIIINATPVGMSHVESTRLIDDDSWITENHVCFDFVYHPFPTPFLADAKRRGARTLSGLALLVSQAQAGFRLWTGREFPLDEMYRAVELEHTKHREHRRHANEILDSR